MFTLQSQGKSIEPTVMQNARYHRERAEHCLRMASDMSDPLAADLMRAAAARHFARAVELEENASVKEPEKPTDFSDSFYHRAIRTRIGQALRSQPPPTEPPPQRVLKALDALDVPNADDQGQEDAGSPPSPGKAREP